MLKKSKRLTRAQFNRFFSDGTRHHTPVAQLIYHPDARPRVSVVVPKKIEKQAVKRNELRRRVYTIMQGVAQSGVFIFVLKQTAKEVSYKELQKEIMTLVTKATTNTTKPKRYV